MRLRGAAVRRSVVSSLKYGLCTHEQLTLSRTAKKMALVADYDSDNSVEDDTGKSGKGGGLELPSAAALLSESSSSVIPSFLNQGSSKPDIDYKSIANSLAREKAEQDKASTAAVSNSDEAAAAGDNAASSSSLAGQKRPRDSESLPAGQVQSVDKKSSSEAAAAATAAAVKQKSAEKEKKKEHVAYKDRAKHQRLSGQSGIGSDFRTWRTDEEMVLRQQYDG